jgi:hypothetical protein
MDNHVGFAKPASVKADESSMFDRPTIRPGPNKRVYRVTKIAAVIAIKF